MAYNKNYSFNYVTEAGSQLMMQGACVVLHRRELAKCEKLRVS